MDALLNWLWRGMLPAIALSIFAKACGPALDANRRYRLWWLTLAAILVSPALSVFGSVTVPDGGLSMSAAPVALPAGAEASTPIIIGLWALLSVVAVLRVVLALLRVRRVARACSPFPAEREIALRHWNALRGKSGTRLVVSKDVRSAAALGVWSPVIAVNPQVVAALDDEELDQIVVHEWAHVERRDHSLNALEHFMLAVFSVHPAIWWTGRQLRLEREVACDERVVSIVGSTKRYAACLLKLKALAGPKTDTLPAPTALTRSQLTTRIHRLLDARRQSNGPGFRLAGALGAAIVVLTSATVAHIELVGLAEPMDETIARVVPGVTPSSLPRDETQVTPAPRSSEPRRAVTSRAGITARRSETAASIDSAAAAGSPRAGPEPAQSGSHPSASSASSGFSSRAAVDVEPLARLDLAHGAGDAAGHPGSRHRSDAKSDPVGCGHRHRRGGRTRIAESRCGDRGLLHSGQQVDRRRLRCGRGKQVYEPGAG